MKKDWKIELLKINTNDNFETQVAKHSMKFGKNWDFNRKRNLTNYIVLEFIGIPLGSKLDVLLKD